MSFSLSFHSRQRCSLTRLVLLAVLFTAFATACSKQESSNEAPAPLTEPEPVAEEIPEPEDPLKEARNDAEGKAHTLIMPITEQAHVVVSEIEAMMVAASPPTAARRPAKIQQEVPTGQFVDERQAQRIIAQHQGAMKNCYERALRRDPSLRGRVVLNLVINPTGKVTRATAKGETLHDSTVNDCMEIHARTIVFPEPTGGSVHLNVPFTFNPQF